MKTQHSQNKPTKKLCWGEKENFDVIEEEIMLGWGELRYLDEEQDGPCRGGLWGARGQQESTQHWQAGKKGGGRTLWLLTPRSFPSSKHLSQHSSTTSITGKKKNSGLHWILLCCPIRCWRWELAHSAVSRSQGNAACHREGTVTIHNGAISFLPLPPCKHSQCTFPPSKIQSKCTAQENDSLFQVGMGRKWGHWLATTAPNIAFLEISLLGPRAAPPLFSSSLGLVPSRTLPLQVWALDQQHWFHLGVWQKSRNSDPTPALLIQNLPVNMTPWWFKYILVWEVLFKKILQQTTT